MLFRSSFDIEYHYYLLWTIYICLLNFYTIFKCCLKCVFIFCMYFMLCQKWRNKTMKSISDCRMIWLCATTHNNTHTHTRYIYILKRLFCFVSMVSEDLNGLNGVDLIPILTILNSDAYYNHAIYLKVMTNWNGFPLPFMNSMIPF